LGSEITSIGQSIKNSERAGNIIATADAALGEVSSLLSDVRNLVQASANKGAISSDEIAANQVQVDNALDAITRISQTTVFGGQKLLNGTKSFTVAGTLGAFNSPTDITINSFDPTLHTSTANDDVSLTVTTQATKKAVTLKGTDFNTGTSNSLLDLSVGTSTRTSTTVITNDFSLADVTSSLNSLSTGSTRATQVVTGGVGGLQDLTGASGQTVTFDIVGEKGTATGLTIDAHAASLGSQVLVDAVNAVADQTGIYATKAGGAHGDVTLTSVNVGPKTVGANFIVATGSTTFGDDGIVTGGTAAITDGTTGVIGTKTTVFTITGNKGSADISTASLSVGGFTGNDAIINNDATNDNGIKAFAALINSRTDSTGVVATVNASTHNLVLTSQGIGSTSLAGITVGTAGADQTLINSASTSTATTGTDGTSNTSTFELIGDLGRAVVTVNNDAVINDSTVLRNAINAVTTQTGLVASGGGFGTDVTLTASKYGSAGIVTVNALAASNSADITLLNANNSRVTVAGADATGTISHSKGGGTFTATGERFSYADDAISLEGSIDPTLTPAVRAATTISYAAVNSGGLGSLSSSATNTIDLQLSGTVNGNTVTTNLTGINVKQLKDDSRYLVDLINATSTASGVRASTTGATGNIVLQSTTLGSGGTVSLTATASTVVGDPAVFTTNAGDTFSATVAGSNPATANNFDVTGGALFQIGPTVNFANQINVNITSLDLSTLGRDYSTTGNKGLSALKTGGTDSLDKADLSTAASIVDQAISQVATLRGKLGAIQKNAIDSNIRSLQTSLEQVTSAQSTIRDADFAVETAGLTRAQILVQAGTSVLALANQSPQNVLALLKG